MSYWLFMNRSDDEWCCIYLHKFFQGLAREGWGGGAIINRVCTQGQLFIYETGCVDIMWPSSAPLIPLRGGQEIAPTRTQ